MEEKITFLSPCPGIGRQTSQFFSGKMSGNAWGDMDEFQVGKIFYDVKKKIIWIFFHRLGIINKILETLDQKEGAPKMNNRKEAYIEFRYYETPIGRYDLALIGDEWVREYGNDPLHFHNYLEIGYCYYGKGNICFSEEKKEYCDGSITIIPANIPHRTRGQVGGIGA